MKGFTFRSKIDAVFVEII